MGPLKLLRSIYDVDTLDTRFTTPSTVPYRPSKDSNGTATPLATSNGRKPSSDRSPRPDTSSLSKRAEPPKWKTPEFYFYGLVFLIAVPNMFRVAYEVSRKSDPRYPKFEKELSPGWIPGRKIDVSDNQYSTFRENLPYMGLLLLFHPLLRRAWNSFFPIEADSSKSASKAPTPEQADARLEQRASFDYVFAYIFLVALHGVSAFKVLLILYVNFLLATELPRRYVPVATWVFNIGTLFANELCDGYKLANVASLLTTGHWGVPGPDAITNLSQDGSSGLLLIHYGQTLDNFGGVMPRWEILFNLTVLRLISFNMDRYWSYGDRGSSSIEMKQLDPAHLSERNRVSIPAPPEDFSFRNYLAYAVYAPLYLTGPIITFNDFICQCRYRAASIEGRRTLLYGIRFALCLLAMEVILHYDYVWAISNASPDWSSYSASQLSLLSYFNLHLIWLKLLLPWRMFRLWALIDGIDAPENMLRCVSNNYSTLSFWRAWHRSYNRWLVRYIWIPLGGSNFRTWRGIARSLLTYVLVFTFVALWHDIQLRLLIWGWLVVLFFIPEVLASLLFPARKWANRPTAYRMLCCAGAVFNVLMMMSANLVGFAVGLDGLESIVHGILHEWSGVLFFVTACGALFVGIQVMFEIRQSELRRGILLKC